MLDDLQADTERDWLKIEDFLIVAETSETSLISVHYG